MDVCLLRAFYHSATAYRIPTIALNAMQDTLVSAHTAWRCIAINYDEIQIVRHECHK